MCARKRAGGKRKASQGRTSNTQHRTSNIQCFGAARAAGAGDPTQPIECWVLGVGCWMFDVQRHRHSALDGRSPSRVQARAVPLPVPKHGSALCGAGHGVKSKLRPIARPRAQLRNEVNAMKDSMSKTAPSCTNLMNKLILS